MTPSLDELLAAIADGRPLEWDALDGEEARASIEGVRLLHDVAQAHRAGDAASVARPPPLFRWGALEIERRIGAGRFGEVWRAFDPWLGRHVALKLQHADAAMPARAGAALDEAQRLAKIRHPNVLVCHGCAVHDGRTGIWSELIEGRTLAQILADDGAFGIDETLRIGRDLALALAAVHAGGLVHGDVKAANVMRESGGRIVLMDFGAGGEERLLAARRLITATPAYLSPEVLDGAPLSMHSDLYALGALLFELVGGRLPYVETGVDALRQAHRAGRRATLAALRPDVDSHATDPIERCFDADVQTRPRSARELADTLAGALRQRRPRTVDRSPRLARTAVALAVLALAAGAVSVAWPYWFPPAWNMQAQFVRTSASGDEALEHDARVAVGDRLQLRLISSRATYVYVLNEDAGGDANVLYPLAVASPEPLPAGDAMLPGTASEPTLAWEVTGDSTREEFLVVAALAPLEPLEASLADWRRSARAPATTRSLGRVVGDNGAPILHGEHLRQIFADLPANDRSVHVWRYAFAHAPIP